MKMDKKSEGCVEDNMRDKEEALKEDLESIAREPGENSSQELEAPLSLEGLELAMRKRRGEKTNPCPDWMKSY